MAAGSPASSSMMAGPYVGSSVPRREDDELLAGQGRFLADLVGAGTLHAVFVRSTHAHALIEELDTTEARSLPGVVAVVSAGDLEAPLGPLPTLHEPHPLFADVFEFSMVDAALPCLAGAEVTYVGQPVAVVVANSRRIAEDAAELVTVGYAPLASVTDAEAALDPHSALVHDLLDTNEAARIRCSFGDVDGALEAASVVVADCYRMGRHGAVPLECRGVIARVDARRNRTEVWTSTQIPHLVQRAICAVTGWPRETVRVVAPNVGGGFGTKANVYAEEVVIPLIARRLERDVAWVEDRLEHLTSAAQGRDQVHRCRLAVDSAGVILAWQSDFVVDIGAGSLWTAGILANTAIHLMGPYRLPAFRVSGRAAFTNKALVAQYRGAGRPEACFALERSLDQAARELGLSPAEIRRRNLPGPDEMPYVRPLPYRDGVPIVYDGGDYGACLEACLQMLPESEAKALADDHPQLLVGHGVATYIEATGRGPYECARVTLQPGGSFEVAAGSACAGQGHRTTLAQVAADALDVDLARVCVRNGDTDAVADGIGTFASRSAVVAGNAVHVAATRLRTRARALAARQLGVSVEQVVPVDAGFATAYRGATLTWGDLAAALGREGSLADEQPLQEIVRYEPRTVTWTMGAHAAVVGVDPDTGLGRVLRYAVAHEGGADIHPGIVEGQVIGGVAQGIGGALLESFGYDADGQPTSGTLAEYLLPAPCDVPTVQVRHLTAPTSANPLGVRGAGESGTIAVYAAIASAIEAATAAQGVRVRSTPVDPSMLALALHTSIDGPA